MKENNKKGKVLLLVLSITVLVLLGFVVINQFVNKTKPIDNVSSSSSNSDTTSHADNASTQKVRVDLNDPVIVNLIYPQYNSDRSGVSGASFTWEFKNASARSMSRDNKMINANAVVEGGELLEAHEYYVTAEAMKKAYHKVFGPDISYTDGLINGANCGMYFKYVQDKSIYTSGDEPCGVVQNDIMWNTKAVPFKAELEGDDLYVYYHFVYYLTMDNKNNNYFQHLPIKGTDYTVEVDNQTNKEKVSEMQTVLLTGSNLETDFEKLVNENKLKTYKYNFKKQSDGKYYFHSGEVE